MWWFLLELTHAPGNFYEHFLVCHIQTSQKHLVGNLSLSDYEKGLSFQTLWGFSYLSLGQWAKWKVSKILEGSKIGHSAT
jgi:hypothetical protein